MFFLMFEKFRQLLSLSVRTTKQERNNFASVPR